MKNIKNQHTSKNNFAIGSKYYYFILIVILIALVATANLTIFNKQVANVGNTKASVAFPSDINNDNKVDVFDLSLLLSNWNTTNVASDLNKDSVVNVFDLSILLSNWGDVVINPPSTNTLTTKPGGWAWQWQLTGTVDTTALDNSSNPNKLYDIDLFDSPKETISLLKNKGIYVICYVEAGDWASGRPDAGDFAPSILGRAISGFPDEKFINVNALDGPVGPTGKSLRQIMTARLQLAKDKGCQGIEPDLDDLHTYTTGFTITQANQVAYNKFLIDTGHSMGMSVGLKNGPDEDTAGSFTTAMYNAGADWVLNEECNQYSECSGYNIFIRGGRPVFQVEYLDNQTKPYSGTTGTCAKNNTAGFDGIVKDSSSILSASPRISCKTGN